MLRRALVFAIVGAVGLAACGSSGSTAATPSTTSSTSSASSTSATSSTTIAPGVVKGTTGWVDATAKWRALAPSAFRTSPEAAADDLAALLRGGDTSEVGAVQVVSVRRGEPAVVVIRETALPDDSVYSVDYEITLEPGDAGWLVSTARAKYSCRRGVDAADPTRCV